MGIIIKQSIRNAALSYTGIAIGFISTVKLYPSILDADQFGLTRTMLAIMFVGTQFIGLGLPSAVIRQFPYLSEKTRSTKGIFILFAIPPTVAFLIFTGLFLLFEDFVLSIYDDSPILRSFYVYILPLILFNSLFNLLKNVLGAHLDTVFASFLQDVSQRVIIVLALALIYFEIIDFKIFVLIFSFNFALQFIILFGYSLRKQIINFSPSFDLLEAETIRKVGSFSLYTFLGGITMIVVGNIDILMIGAYTDFTQTAIYSVAFYVGTVISVPRRSVYKISYPIITKAFQRNDMEEVNKVYKQTSLNQFLVGFLIYIGVWANLDNLYAILPEQYAEGSLVILIIGAANLFDMICGANGQIILASKYYRFDLVATSFLVIISIVLNVIFIPMLGIYGAAVATASSILLYNLIKLVFVWIKFKSQPFTRKSVGLIANGFWVLWVSSLLPDLGNIYLDVLFKAVVMAGLYVGIIYVFKLSDEFNHTLKSIYQKLFG